MERFVERAGVDELMIASRIFDHDARVRLFEIAMGVWSSRGGRGSASTSASSAVTVAVEPGRTRERPGPTGRGADLLRSARLDLR